MIQDPIFLSILFLQALVNIFIIKLWNSPQLARFHGVYQAEQKIHKGFIPRFGGMAILLSLFFVDFLEVFSQFNSPYLGHILICLLPLIFVTFLEDIYNNILPLARLFFIFISSFWILSSGDFVLPVIDLSLVSQFFIDFPWVLILLLTISMAAMVNAFNLIDGANGLLLFTFISILGCLTLMAEFVSDDYFVHLFQLLIIICFCQTLFNFPRARMFAGDLGAYSFGYIVAILLIIFFGRYPEFLTWQAILILFYPAFELLFTITRRVRNNKNPLQADRLHLHQLIFTILEKRTGNSVLSNSMTTILLFPLWGYAFLWLLINGSQLDLKMICLGLFINALLYLVYYRIATNLEKNV